MVVVEPIGVDSFSMFRAKPGIGVFEVKSFNALNDILSEYFHLPFNTGKMPQYIASVRRPLQVLGFFGSPKQKFTILPC